MSEVEVSTPEAAINGLRAKLDAVDEQLMALIIERCRIGGAIGHIKATCCMPIHQPEREQEVLYRCITAAGANQLNPIRVREIWRHLMAMSADRQVLVGWRAHGERSEQNA